MRKKALPAILAPALLLSACGPQAEAPRPQAPPPATLFALLDSNATGVGFINRLIEGDGWNILVYEYLYNGAGVGAGDVNNDGLCDLFFVSNTGQDHLYQNLGGMRFMDITREAGIGLPDGYKSGVSMADVNGDGWLDIHVCRDASNNMDQRRNLLYINNRDGSFSERAKEFGLDDPSFSTQAYFFDMDQDGDLDLYLVNHPNDMRTANTVKVSLGPRGEYMLARQDDFEYASDRLYRNEGGRFTDVTKAMGLLNAEFGLSAAIADLNSDLTPDIFVGNDYVGYDQLLISGADQRWSNEAQQRLPHATFNSMGSDLADINNDGLTDIVCLDMTASDPYRYKTLVMSANHSKHETLLAVGLGAQFSVNAMHINHGDGSFGDVAHLAGMAYTDWSWSPLLADLDNDGWKDLLVTNGFLRDISNLDYARYTMDSLQKEMNAGRITLTDWLTAIPSVKLRSYLFRNNGDLTFSDSSGRWNVGPPAFSNGAAYADLDNDGDLDLMMNNINDACFILRNEAAQRRANSSVRIKPVNAPGRTAFGTRAVLTLDDDSKHYLELQPARGFLSCSEPVLHFGLPEGRRPRTVEIVWPDGLAQTIEAPATGAMLTIERAATGLTRWESPRLPLLANDLSNQLPKGLGHRQNKWIDFKREPLLHTKLSEEGPAAAVGDVNGDGLDDLFIGGGKSMAGSLAPQRSDGSFAIQHTPAILRDSTFEDVAALFFDADGDADLDLYVGSGGNERPVGDAAYRDRLYLNDGKGGFTRADGALPDLRESTGCVAAHDIDGDGDLDLFVGARLVPGRYPEPPRSVLLRNEGGRFSDATAIWAPGLDRLGMLSAARFADLDGDGRAELVLAGEWMPITVLQWKNNAFVNATADWGLSDTEGWWCGIDIADADGDGRPDILAINNGLNTHWSASKSAPLQLCYKDFDGNGSVDPILCQTFNGQAVPAHNRDRVLDQMVFLKKRFLRNDQYALASFNDLFTSEERQGVRTLRTTTLANTILLNEGKRFRSEPLPLIAQRSAARASRFLDADGDGIPEILVAGNFFGTDPQFGRTDAEAGTVLKRSDSGWKPVAGHFNRLFQGDARHALPVRGPSGTMLLVVRNNGLCGMVDLVKPLP